MGVTQPSSAIALAFWLALLSLVVNVFLVAANRRVGVIACFPLVALSTLGSGLAWTLTVASSGY
jgi:hypothetical protein